MGVVIGLIAALSFGAADFLGGLAAKKVAPLAVAWLNQIVAIPVVMALLVFFPVTAWNTEDMVLAVFGGVAMIVALQLLYRVLRSGAMRVLVSVTGIVSAVIPFAFALSQGETLGSVAAIGIVVAFVAIVVVAKGPEDAREVLAHRKQVLTAAAAGVLFGLVWMLIVRGQDSSGALPLLLMRVVGFVVASVLIFPKREWRAFDRASLSQAAVAGGFAMVATVLFLVAERLEVVAIVSVLQGMAPVATAVLAFVVLRQRLARTQLMGMGLALVAALLLALD